MAIKTIVVHLHDSEEADRVLRPAVGLAKRQGAHLTGLHVTPGVTALPGYGYELPTAVLASIEMHNRERSAAIHERFEAALASEAGLMGDWQEASALGPDPSPEIVEHARRADLVMIGQAPADAEAMHWELGGKLILESGRPVLLIPYAGEHPTTGTRVMVAWNGSRESARAVFDAIPLMQEAEEVRIFGVGGRLDSDSSDLPGAELAATLSRHGLKVISEGGARSPLSVSDELLNRCADHGSDLLVMGGYGHSRAREFLFGGVTRDILKTMTVPVLFSH